MLYVVENCHDDNRNIKWRKLQLRVSDDSDEISDDNGDVSNHNYVVSNDNYVRERGGGRMGERRRPRRTQGPTMAWQSREGLFWAPRGAYWKPPAVKEKKTI
jgi:hypothetical protein